MPAYLVKTDSDVNEWDEGSDIVFADTEQDARSLSELGVESEYLLVERVPEFDILQGKGHDELRAAQLLAGWWFTCSECECHVFEDYHIDDGDEVEGTPVIIGDSVYCSADCYETHLECHRRYAENERLVCEEAMQRWPGIEVVSSNGIEMLDNAVVGGAEFRFPGGLGTARWTRTSKDVFVQKRDLEAWNNFAQRQSCVP
jgi:hypothetical protein